MQWRKASQWEERHIRDPLLRQQIHQRVVTLKKGRIISDVPADKEAIRARAERKERLFETELEPADTAEKEAATV